MNELKPCPFCGELPKILVEQDRIEEWATCETLACCANGDRFLLWDWNTRPIEDALQKELDRQREINKTIAHDIQKGAREGYKQLEDALQENLKGMELAYSSMILQSEKLQAKLDIAVEALKVVREHIQIFYSASLPEIQIIDEALKKLEEK